MLILFKGVLEFKPKPKTARVNFMSVFDVVTYDNNTTVESFLQKVANKMNIPAGKIKDYVLAMTSQSRADAKEDFTFLEEGKTLGEYKFNKTVSLRLMLRPRLVNIIFPDGVQISMSVDGTLQLYDLFDELRDKKELPPDCAAHLRSDDGDIPLPLNTPVRDLSPDQTVVTLVLKRKQSSTGNIVEDEY
jgi:hypothetical protein